MESERTGWGFNQQKNLVFWFAGLKTRERKAKTFDFVSHQAHGVAD
jgi:hypothetical protein